MQYTTLLYYYIIKCNYQHVYKYFRSLYNFFVLCCWWHYTCKCEKRILQDTITDIHKHKNVGWCAKEPSKCVNSHVSLQNYVHEITLYSTFYLVQKNFLMFFGKLISVSGKVSHTCKQLWNQWKNFRCFMKPACLVYASIGLKLFSVAFLCSATAVFRFCNSGYTSGLKPMEHAEIHVMNYTALNERDQCYNTYGSDV